ncbi:MAG: mechanosensitive ion channel, partial [Deltaproteobacteria bacterium]|nr:mechanosensitive ion channel [Deltaproteobacteria bacterium]
VRVTVEVAYGSDVDQVREVLMSCAEGVDHVRPDPEPRVRFREFMSSGLRFQLMAWIDEPVLRGRTLDALNTRVYKELGRAGIEIPFPKRDVYIKETPEMAQKGAA